MRTYAQQRKSSSSTERDCASPAARPSSAAATLQQTIGNRAVARAHGARVGGAARAGFDAALRSPAQPLDSATRSFFGNRFGHDFGDVRVHTGREAADSALALRARAYTIGRDVVFGAGEYEPQSELGRGLLAHELTHVVQQAGAGAVSGEPFVQRACLEGPDCAKPADAPRAATAAEFGNAVQEESAPKLAAKRAESAAAAMASGHGRRAVELEKLFDAKLKKLRPLIHAVVIDDTLPATVGAGRVDCAEWAKEALPPDADHTPFQGAKHSCIIVPPSLEEEAKTFNNLPSTAPDKQRAELLNFIEFDILRTFTHEVTHERVLASKIDFPAADAQCTKEGLTKEVSELAAVISEYPIVSDLPPDGVDTFHKAWADARLQDPKTVTTPTESISGSIRDIRCSCQCGNADSLIRQAFEIASALWPEKKKQEFHIFMKRGAGSKYGVYWPYDGVPVGSAGSNEFSLTGGIAFAGSDKTSVAMLTYRRVIASWVDGKLRLTAGLQGNLARLWEPTGEYGALLGGIGYMQRPKSRDQIWGGFTARAEIGAGLGDFSLKAPDATTGATTNRTGDLVLQIGTGIQFYIPGAAGMTPISLEAGLRLGQPFDKEAERVKTGTLSLVFPF